MSDESWPSFILIDRYLQLVAASRPLNRVPPSGMTTGACWSAMAASGATGGPGGAPPSFVEPRVDGTTVGDAPSSSLLISWPLAAAAAAVCNAVQPTQRTTSPPYWSRQHGNTMMGVGGGFMEKQHKMSMVTTATQTDQVLKVDSCCGTDDGQFLF